MPTFVSLRSWAAAPRRALLLLVAVGALGCSSPRQGTDAGSELDATPGDVAPADLVAGDLPPGDPGPSDTSVDAAPEVDVSGAAAWGWISAIEWNDTCDQWYMKTQWFGGVRAYFADAPNYNRALPHTLGWCTARATVGACTLYDPGLMDDQCLHDGGCMCLDKGVECYSEDRSTRWCGEDEYCVKAPGGPSEDWDGVCAPLPTHYDVGAVTLTGLKTPVAMLPDALDRYKAAVLPDPNDLFDAGDPITATTQGGELPPLTFQARGVAPLEVSDPVVHVLLGQDQPATVRWVPADPQSRVQVVLMGGSHDPNPLAAAIVCDAPDSAGQVDVAGSLLAELYRLSCNGGWLLKCSRITRYDRDLQTLGGKEVELFVGSARNLQLWFE